MEEGEARGESRGEARGLKDGIALALEVRFGEAGKQLASDLGPVNDLETLRRIAGAIRAAAGVEDVRRAWLS